MDSAVCLALSVKAVGPERTKVLILPTEETPSEDTQDAVELAKELGVEHTQIHLGNLRDQMAEAFEVTEPMDLGNLASRARMAALYAHARKDGFLVLGTSNKSELLVGYFTKYGDGGSDIAPIGDLYKTQVNELARRLDLPQKIIEKAPRAGLIADQTDEGELGLPYSELDAILMCKERRMTLDNAVKATGFDLETVQRIYSLVDANIHKRRLGLIPKIGLRTVGIDWREV